MKILKESSSYLQNNYLHNRWLGIILLLVSIFACILGFYFIKWLYLIRVIDGDIAKICLYLLIILGLVSFSYGLGYLNNSRSYKAGIAGEKAVIEALAELDDSHFLINDILVDENFGNIDHVLLSPKGIFVIETKNYSGTVRCNDDYWEKKGSYRFYNIESVSKQAKRNAVYLSELIQGRANIKMFVRPVCVFTDPYIELRLYRPTVPVLRVSELATFLQEAPPAAAFTSSRTQLIADCILQKR